MLENLRRKSLVKTYIDPTHLVRFEQGHAIYWDSFRSEQYRQRFSKENQEKSFSSTFDGVSKEFRLIADTLEALKFNMIVCPSGTFTEGHIDQKNKPLRSKTIDKPFLLGETEVTNEMYGLVDGYPKTHDIFKKPKHPKVDVSWFDAIRFCNKLSDLQNLDRCYTQNSSQASDYVWYCDFSKNGYRLPTEEEWEYAAKAGTQNRWAGTDEKDKVGEYAIYGSNSANKDKNATTHPVKTKLPNEWGFYDMSGNVWEWCWNKRMLNADDTDPRVERIIRGGCFLGDFEYSPISTFHIRSKPALNGDNQIGFRVARSFSS